MSRSVEELTKSEAELLERLGSVSGLMGEKTAQLKANGVFDGFAQIYREYAASDDPEALKRAIFFFWFQYSEPSCFSGLEDLPKETSDLVFQKLERLAAEENIDSELRWMLPYYYSITDWLFDTVYKSSETLKRILTHDGDRWYENVKREDFVNRGRMGQYWRSVNPKIGFDYEKSRAKQ